MERTYVIAWRSVSEPRVGQGKKLLTREEAESLVEQLNVDYPAFVHEPVNLAHVSSPPQGIGISDSVPVSAEARAREALDDKELAA